MSGPILVTTATGRQGRALIRALLELPSPPATILAVTRSTTSAGAQKLATTSPSIKLVQGNLDDVPTLFKEALKVSGQPIWGVYSVQLPQGMGNTNEVEQGKAVVDESLKQNVKHFVYSSVDRGGNEKSWTNPTDIPHFQSKHNLELYLREKAKDSKMTWTILRPVAFMDNLEPGFQARVFFASLKGSMEAKKSLQWIAVRDIGVFGAKAFQNPEEYNGKAIGLAGDDLTLEQTTEAFKEATGTPLTPTFSIFGSALKMAMKEMRLMIDWFGSDGYGVDIPALKKVHPDLIDMKRWIVEESNFPKK